LIGLTARSSDDVLGFAGSIAARVRAMASVHELLSSSHWAPLSVGSLIAALTPTGCTGCVFTRGDPIQVPAAQGTALGMVIHELLTNSLKHGALGSSRGTVHIQWRGEGEPKRHAFTWRERGGPPIVSPPTPGLGTRLVQGLVRSDLRGSLELGYPRDGAEHRFTVQLEANAETRVTVGAGSAHDADS
jgi:two-component sensor histidine kinase